MTREEKINTLKAIIQECEEYQWQRREILFEIIKDLESGRKTVTEQSIGSLSYSDGTFIISAEEMVESGDKE